VIAPKIGSPYKISQVVPAVGSLPIRISAVYAAGPSKMGPLKIGHSIKPKSRISQLQTDNHEPVDIYAIAWTVDSKLSFRVERRCHKILKKAGRHVRGEWFDIDAEWAKKVIAVAAREEGIPLYSNREVRELSASRGELKMRQMIEDSGILSLGM